MIKIILIGSFCVYLICYHPSWVILAGLICGIVHLIRRYDLTPAVSKDRESDLSPEDYPTPEEKAKKQAEAMMKPGYKDDPKWQALAKKVGKHVEEQQRKEEQEMHLEDLTNEII